MRPGLVLADKKHYILPLIVSLLPAAYYFQVIYQYALNIPHWDDYDAILKFVIDFTKTESIIEKIRLLFAQHNEHRIALVRISSLLMFYINGTINFKGIILLGNLFLLLITGVLFLSFQKESSKDLYYFIPVSFFIFQLLNFENSVWAMATLQNFGVLTMALLSAYFLSKRSAKHFIFACVFAVAATFSSGNGMLIFMAGLLSLFLQGRTSKERIIWTLLAILSIGLYFYSYTKPAHHPKILETLELHFESITGFFLMFLASGFRIIETQGIIYNVALGTLLTVTYLKLWSNGYARKNMAVFTQMTFIVLTAGAAALTRGGFGAEAAVTSRYSINSVVLVSLLYIAFMESYRDKFNWFLFSPALIASIYFNYKANVIALPIVEAHHQNLKALGSFPTASNGARLSYPDQALAQQLMVQANYYGIYQLPGQSKHSSRTSTERPDYLQTLTDPAGLPKNSHPIVFSLDEFNQQEDSLIISGWAFMGNESNLNTDIKIVLLSPTANYLVKPDKEKRPDVSRHFNTVNLEHSGFYKAIDLHALQPSVYAVGLLIKDHTNNREAFSLTDKYVYVD